MALGSAVVERISRSRTLPDFDSTSHLATILGGAYQVPVSPSRSSRVIEILMPFGDWPVYSVMLGSIVSDMVADGNERGD